MKAVCHASQSQDPGDGQGAVVRSQLQHGIEQRDCRVKQPPLCNLLWAAEI